MEILIGVAAIAVIGLFVVASTYNNLVKLRQGVRESWSAIETELRRRYDLIPNLVEVVKGYAEHERGTLEEVVRARNAAITVTGSPGSAAQADAQLSSALKQVFALSESYPQLQANDNFRDLQNKLEETETRISQARRFYNANVRELNSATEMFPSVLIARSMGFKPEPYFGIDDADAFEPVRISGLSSDGTRQSGGGTIKISDSVKELEK